MEVDPDDQQFDVEAYANNFSGHGKIARLLFLAEKTTNQRLKLEALRFAADELKLGENTGKYVEVVAVIKGKLAAEYELDQDWVDKTNQTAIRRQENLETELNAYKTNLIKESIRLGHSELGNHHYARGQLAEAFKCYVRSRDYCTTSKHHLTACLHAIRCGIELGQFVHVSNYVLKAEQQPDVRSHPDVTAKVVAASGLAAMDARNFKGAALKFTEVGPELGTSWNNVIAPQEIALYGVLCGLAHFDRRELKQHIIDNVNFREYLEVYPEVRELVNDFYGSKYASCMSQLHRLQPLLSLDLHLSRHAKELCAAVRSKALVQYTAPFVSVHLPSMATAFNMDAGKLEEQIADLIQGGQIQARIDSGSHVLYKRRADVRSGIFAAALQASEEYIRETRALLLRANLQRYDLIQKGSPGQRRNKGFDRSARGGRGGRGDRERGSLDGFAAGGWLGDEEEAFGGFGHLE